jgi:hypothetical protein
VIAAASDSSYTRILRHWILGSALLALRQQRLAPVRIARHLGLSRATVARICARAGLNRLSELELLPPPVREPAKQALTVSE